MYISLSLHLDFPSRDTVEFRCYLWSWPIFFRATEFCLEQKGRVSLIERNCRDQGFEWKPRAVSRTPTPFRIILEARSEYVSLDKCKSAVVSVLGELLGLFAQEEQRTEGAGRSLV